MRKKTTKKWWDTTFWYIIYMLPIIIAIISSIGAMGNDGFYSWFENDLDMTNWPVIKSLESILSMWGFYGESPIGIALYDIFNIDGGYFPIIGGYGSWIYPFAEYFVAMVVVHLMIDFILFIPRFAHKIMDKCYQDD